MAVILLPIDPTGTPGRSPLMLRPLAPQDTADLQAMLDDDVVREAMHWTDARNRDAVAFIAAAAAEQALDAYRFRYVFGVEAAHSQLAGVAIVEIGEMTPRQFPPAFQTSLTIFFGEPHRSRGYGRRTLTRLRDWSFEELRLTSIGDQTVSASSVAMEAVTAVCRPDNTASAKILGDLLVPQGQVELKHRGDGSTVEALAFTMTRSQYELLSPHRSA